jgi:putative colanic acid biosynthesis acetyltransferase WcaF
MLIQDGRNHSNPYSRRERLARIAWLLAYWLIYRPVPRLLKGWHISVLRCFGARIGGGTIIYPSTEIYFPWRLDIGDFCVIGDRVKLYSLGYIHIGRHTVISQNTHICAGTHDYSLPHMPLVRSEIFIGQGCWICTDAFLGPGAVVGDHSVIGARAVVVSPQPAGMVCAGNPCRPIKKRTMRNVQ